MNARAVIDKLLETALWLLLAAMAIVVALSAFCRYALNHPLSWGDEIPKILLVWLTFLGGPLAVRDDDHYSLNFLSRKLSGTGLRRLLLTRDLATLAAIGVLLYYSAIVTWRIRSWIMPATEISRALVYGACPVGCALMLYYAFARLNGRLRAGHRTNSPTRSARATGYADDSEDAS